MHQTCDLSSCYGRHLHIACCYLNWVDHCREVYCLATIMIFVSSWGSISNSSRVHGECQRAFCHRWLMHTSMPVCVLHTMCYVHLEVLTRVLHHMASEGWAPAANKYIACSWIPTPMIELLFILFAAKIATHARSLWWSRWELGLKGLETAEHATGTASTCRTCTRDVSGQRSRRWKSANDLHTLTTQLPPLVLPYFRDSRI